MAIYSLSHSTVGRSTHKKNTAAAHINYITRSSVLTEIIANDMPDNRHKAVRWMNAQEYADRKNARVIDKIMIALPVELTDKQHKTLILDYCQQLTQNRVPYYVAIHSRKKDAHNPHAHIVIRDRDFETGKRFINMSERGSTEMIRELWQNTCNTHLALHGHKTRIDRHSLKDQDIDRNPQIHVGPNANEAAKRGAKLKSKNRIDKNGREIRYPEIDKGKTRRDFNEHIIDLNLERLKRSKNYGIQLKSDFEAEQRGKDRGLLQKRDNIRSAFRQANGQLWKNYQTKQNVNKQTHKAEKEQYHKELKARFKPLWKEHFTKKEQALYEFEQTENKFAGQFKDLKEYLFQKWGETDTTKIKTNSQLSTYFNHMADKSGRLKELKSQYNSEHREIYKSYTDRKNAIHRMLKKKYDPYYKTTKNEWLDNKVKLKEQNGNLWKEFNKEQKTRRKEASFERENLKTFISDYYNNLSEQPVAEQDNRFDKKMEKRDAQKSHLNKSFEKASQGKPEEQDKEKTRLEKIIERMQKRKKELDRDPGRSM